MSAGKYNMNICQGSDFKLVMTLYDSAGALLDLDDHTFRGQIRKTISEATVVASFSFTILDQITDKGKVEVLLSGSVSTGIEITPQNTVERKVEKFSYDVESTSISSGEKRWLEGVVELSPEVTR